MHHSTNMNSVLDILKTTTKNKSKNKTAQEYKARRHIYIYICFMRILKKFPREMIEI